jgi:hypothetical protein
MTVISCGEEVPHSAGVQLLIAFAMAFQRSGVASNLWGALAAMKGDIDSSSSDLGDKVRAASRYRGRWPKLSVWHGGSDNTVAPSVIFTRVAGFSSDVRASRDWLKDAPLKLGDAVDIHDEADLERCCLEWQRSCSAIRKPV